MIILIGNARPMSLGNNDEQQQGNTTEPITILNVFGTEAIHQEMCENITTATDNAGVITLREDLGMTATSKVGPPGSLTSLNCLSTFDKHLMISLLCTIHKMRDSF